MANKPILAQIYTNYPSESVGKKSKSIQRKKLNKLEWYYKNAKDRKRFDNVHRLLPDMLKEVTFIGVATTRGASGESLTANLSCMNRLSIMDSSFSTIL